MDEIEYEAVVECNRNLSLHLKLVNSQMAMIYSHTFFRNEDHEFNAYLSRLQLNEIRYMSSMAMERIREILRRYGNINDCREVEKEIRIIKGAEDGSSKS